MSNIKVKKSEPAESKEVLAAAITNISQGMTKMLHSGLNKKAIIILLQHETKLPQRDIRLILDSLPRLAAWYCK